MTGFNRAWRKTVLVAPALVLVATVSPLAAGSASPIAAGSAGGAAFVRTDQLGYAPHASKRAYLISSVPETGATFSLRSSAGSTVWSGSVGGPARRWSDRYPYVYALDFDGLAATGTYILVVSGPAPASSAPFAIAPAVELYRRPLANALAFYRVQRDGPDFIRSALRSAAAHLNDRHGRVYRTPRTNSDGNFAGNLTPVGESIDASGGWWDAGDYLKFVQTTSYVVDLMLVGVREFPAEMGAGAGPASFTGEARFGLSWLLRMWNDRSRTLYYQVGIGSGNRSTAGDHDIWRVPQADDTYGGRDPKYRYIRNRPVFRAGPSGSPISPNLAGRDAAAFALCFQVFKHSDARLAKRCLRSGEHIFALANTHPGRLVTAIPWDFYPEIEWRDDLELGAVELANALTRGGRPRGLPHTRPAYYLRQAARWARAYMRQGDDATDPLNLYDVSGLADYELYRALQRAPRTRGLAITPPMVLDDLRRQLNGAIAHARSDPFAFGYPWNASDTASHAAGLSVLASEYARLTGDAAARAWSVRWLDNLLGANAWGSSFIVGDGGAFPRCLQHQVANLVGSRDGSAPRLDGAVVEGPTSSATDGLLDHMLKCPVEGGDSVAQFNGAGAVFRDNVQSYSTVEPAIDLTASSPLAFAWQMAGSGSG